MKKSLGFVFVVLLLILGGIIVYFVSNINSSLEVSDSSALFGGRFEFGYTSAAYLINVTNNSTKSCGTAIISNDTAITAAHCVDGASELFIGKELYAPGTSSLVKVDKAIQKIGWIEGNTRSQDFAVLTFQSENYFNSYAEISTPIEGCFYRIVAYGRTELDNEVNKPRKSSKLCVFDIREDTFRVRGEDSGICFGDSGSPIFFDDTNKVVGVIASIILEDEENKDPCSFGNTAIVVRTDSNINLVRSNVQKLPTQNELDVSSSLTIEVAQEDLFDKLGLDYFGNLPEKQKNIYYLVATVIVISILIILLLVVLLRPKTLEH
jgi:hypothetical protein